MFTTEQIKEKLSKVRTGADFPALAMELKNIGVTYYETKIKDGVAYTMVKMVMNFMGVQTMNRLKLPRK